MYLESLTHIYIHTYIHKSFPLPATRYPLKHRPPSIPRPKWRQPPFLLRTIRPSTRPPPHPLLPHRRLVPGPPTQSAALAPTPFVRVPTPVLHTSLHTLLLVHLSPNVRDSPLLPSDVRMPRSPPPSPSCTCLLSCCITCATVLITVCCNLKAFPSLLKLILHLHLPFIPSPPTCHYTAANINTQTCLHSTRILTPPYRASILPYTHHRPRSNVPLTPPSPLPRPSPPPPPNLRPTNAVRSATHPPTAVPNTLAVPCVPPRQLPSE